MSHPPGTRLGSYEIISKLGEGGMGEVYRARDTKLNRDVAIKVLPEIFAVDPDRLARFEREAQTLAALNHPNIAQIYGIVELPAEAGSHTSTRGPETGTHTSTRGPETGTHTSARGPEVGSHTSALVMEVVDGEDLSAIIARGALPLGDALPIARQIADALEAAHEQGIIHRDLKPANIKIRADGTVKVLDFGLAKAFATEPAASAAALMNSPTMMSPAMTQVGFIVGTAAYMAPEQARGKAVDRRADIWAFGVLLYEMLTGRRPFEGEDVSSTLANVLKDEIKWETLPPTVPGSVRRLLRRCLDKDPRRRLSAIGDARFELDDHSDGDGRPVAARRMPWLAWAGITALLIAVAMLATALMVRRDVPARTTRLSIVPPESTELYPDSRESALSPDGTTVAFVTGTHAGAGASQLWIRPLGTSTSRLVDGATGAHLPFWSPDSRRIAFFADGKLKTAAPEGGRIEVVCAAPDGRGGTWSPGGTIVFAPSNAGALQKVSAAGGDPTPVTALDTARNETSHRFPFFLPDGRHFTFATLPADKGLYGIYVASIDGGERVRLLAAESAAVYTPPGYLLYSRQGVLAAHPFDAARLRFTGDAIPFDDVPGLLGNEYSSGAAVSASSAALVYLSDPFSNTRLVWVDRDGRETGTVEAAAARYMEIKLSPDGQRLAVVRRTSAKDSAIWVIDLIRHGATRIGDSPHLNYSVAWSPDGRRLAYTNDGSGTETVMTRDAAGAMPETVMFASADLFKKPESWSPDGRGVLMTNRVPATQDDLVVVSTEGERKATPYLNEPFGESVGRFSPDGHWVAYASDESGSNDIYVRSYPVPDHKYRVTTDGGTAVWWKADGTELLILGSDGRELKRAAVRLLGAELSIAPPMVVGALPAGVVAVDAARDLQHLLVAIPRSGTGSASLTVVSNWLSGLVKQ